MQTSKLHIISGISREKLAAALVEYRAFIQANPGETASAMLAGVIEDIHTALHQQREISRATR
jgi:hypothetical protein